MKFTLIINYLPLLLQGYNVNKYVKKQKNSVFSVKLNVFQFF